MTKAAAKNRKVLSPRLGKRVFVDPSAQVIGDVRIGDDSSVWPGCSLRGDLQKIVIGRCSNIQDLSMIHVETDQPCRIGDYVVVGHRVILHACSVENQSLIGMGSIVLDGARIGSETILGAGSLVTEGQRLKSGYLYFGRPAKQIRKLSREEIRGLKRWAERYMRYAADHLKGRYGRLAPPFF